MKYSLFHSSSLEFPSGPLKEPPGAELSLTQCRAALPQPPPKRLCKRPVSTALSGRSHDMAFVSFLLVCQWSWPKTATGDCQEMQNASCVCILLSKREDKQPFPLPSISPERTCFSHLNGLGRARN